MGRLPDRAPVAETGIEWPDRGSAEAKMSLSKPESNGGQLFHLNFTSLVRLPFSILRVSLKRGFNFVCCLNCVNYITNTSNSMGFITFYEGFPFDSVSSICSLSLRNWHLAVIRWLIRFVVDDPSFIKLTRDALLDRASKCGHRRLRTKGGDDAHLP